MKPFLSDRIQVDENTTFQLSEVNLRFASFMEPEYSNGIEPKPPRQVDNLRGELVVRHHSKNADESYLLFGEARRYRPALTTHSVGIAELPLELQKKLKDAWAEVEQYLRDKTEKVGD
jgi:hypothetical protein